MVLVLGETYLIKNWGNFYKIYKILGVILLRESGVGSRWNIFNKKFPQFFISEFYSWKNLHLLYKCIFIFRKKGNKYISTYKSQCFKGLYDFMLGHTHCSAGPHAARWPRVGQPCSRKRKSEFNPSDFKNLAGANLAPTL